MAMALLVLPEVYTSVPSRVCLMYCLYLTNKGIVHFEIIFWYVLAYLKPGHPRCRCLCFHSSINFYIFRSNRSCLWLI